jgi:hypothetical protein
MQTLQFTRTHGSTMYFITTSHHQFHALFVILISRITFFYTSLDQSYKQNAFRNHARYA